MIEAIHSASLVSNPLIEEAIRSWRRGGSEWATELLEKSMLADPSDGDLYAVYRPIVEWRDSLRSGGFPLRVDLGEDCCLLEPLGPHHAADFLAVYDPEIARLCCLPKIRGEEEWQAWLHQQQSYQDQLTLAIIVPEIGTIGMLCLVAQGDIGFIFYWLGERYRGRGIVSRAAGALLGRATAHWGIHTFYAKAFRQNLASHSVLARLGFETLPFQGREPHEEEIFFRLGHPCDEISTAMELDRFMVAIGSDVRPMFLRTA